MTLIINARDCRHYFKYKEQKSKNLMFEPSFFPQILKEHANIKSAKTSFEKTVDQLINNLNGIEKESILKNLYQILSIINVSIRSRYINHPKAKNLIEISSLKFFCKEKLKLKLQNGGIEKFITEMITACSHKHTSWDTVASDTSTIRRIKKTIKEQLYSYCELLENKDVIHYLKHEVMNSNISELFYSVDLVPRSKFNKMLTRKIDFYTNASGDGIAEFSFRSPEKSINIHIVIDSASGKEKPDIDIQSTKIFLNYIENSILNTDVSTYFKNLSPHEIMSLFIENLKNRIDKYRVPDEICCLCFSVLIHVKTQNSNDVLIRNFGDTGVLAFTNYGIVNQSFCFPTIHTLNELWQPHGRDHYIACQNEIRNIDGIQELLNFINAIEERDIYKILEIKIKDKYFYKNLILGLMFAFENGNFENLGLLTPLNVKLLGVISQVAKYKLMCDAGPQFVDSDKHKRYSQTTVRSLAHLKPPTIQGTPHAHLFLMASDGFWDNIHNYDVNLTLRDILYYSLDSLGEDWIESLADENIQEKFIELSEKFHFYFLDFYVFLQKNELFFKKDDTAIKLLPGLTGLEALKIYFKNVMRYPVF